MNKELPDKLDALDDGIDTPPGGQKTAGQRAVVAQRMASPRTYASDAGVKAILRRFQSGP